MDLKYTKATDSQHVIKLESALMYAGWKSAVAPLGQAVPLEVVTAFVGYGAQIKIKGKSDGGKTLGSISGKVKNNVFVGELTIPDSVKIGDAVYFEVDLSANGITGESNHIPAVPPIKVTNMKWSVPEARRGDVVTLSATVKGVADKAESKVSIFEYDTNGAHDRITELPAAVDKNKLEVKWEYEYHEDTHEIPTDKQLKKYGKSYNHPEYFFVVEIEGQRFGKKQESGLLRFKDYGDIVLTSLSATPIPDQDYVLYMPDGSQRKGKLDKNGRAIERGVPPGGFRVEFPNL